MIHYESCDCCAEFGAGGKGSTLPDSKKNPTRRNEPKQRKRDRGRTESERRGCGGVEGERREKERVDASWKVEEEKGRREERKRVWVMAGGLGECAKRQWMATAHS